MGKKIIFEDFGQELDWILDSFVDLKPTISYIISDKRKISGVKTISLQKLNNIPDLQDYYFILGASKNFTKNKIMFYNMFKIPMTNIISIHDFIITFIDSSEGIILRPPHICIEASTICNLNCLDCYMRKNNNGTMGRGYLKIEDFKSFIENNKFIKSVELANSGEVFMNPDLKEIITYAKEKQIFLSMSNGVNFNYIKDDVLEELVSSKIVSSIVVAIDGVSQDVYSIYRRQGNINHVIENIKKVNALKDKYKVSHPLLTWQYILFDHNQHEAEDAAKLAKELNMDIFFKLDWGTGLTPKDPEKLKEITGLDFFDRTSYNRNNLDTYVTNNMCKQLYRLPQVNYDGRLLGCCAVYESDWGINVFKEGYLNAINSKNYLSAVKMIFGGGIVNIDCPCTKCSQLKIYSNGKMLYF